jgi:hypothetical protein
METIDQYVNALFAKLPATLEILHLKDAVAEEARAQYAALCADGADPYAAVGRVLSSIGSVDELLARHGVSLSSSGSAAVQEAPSLDSDVEPLDEETEDYLDAQYNAARMIALGVGLCIVSPAFPILYDLFPRFLGHFLGEGLGAVGLFGAIAAAVMLFIYANSLKQSWRAYPYAAQLTAGMRRELRLRAADYAARRTGSIALGVGLCIFSVSMPIFFNSALGAALMFAMVAWGVYLMILSDTRAKACRRLLKNQ